MVGYDKYSPNYRLFNSQSRKTSVLNGLTHQTFATKRKHCNLIINKKSLKMQENIWNQVLKKIKKYIIYEIDRQFSDQLVFEIQTASLAQL